MYTYIGRGFEYVLKLDHLKSLDSGFAESIVVAVIKKLYAIRF